VSNPKLRQAIAAEAARLIYQGKASEFFSARRKAARRLTRQRLSPNELPTNAEIQNEVHALAGLFSGERQSAALVEMRLAARELMQLLADYEPRLVGDVLTGPILPGAELTLQLRGDDPLPILDRLHDAGLRGEIVFIDDARDSEADDSLEPAEDDEPPATSSGTTIRLLYRFPCRLEVTPKADAAAERPGLTLDDLEQLLAEHRTPYDEVPEDEADAADEEEEDYHPDAFPLMRVLLQSLERVKFDPRKHPEGDALYHSLQVFELGLAQRPYDEEFLLACLLHDVGYGIDRRNPVTSALIALGELITPRTRFFIEHLPEGVEYLTTGKVRSSLRRSEDFDDLVLLARCDLNGRVRGAPVRTVDEALEYIAGLSTAWDDA